MPKLCCRHVPHGPPHVHGIIIHVHHDHHQHHPRPVLWSDMIIGLILLVLFIWLFFLTDIFEQACNDTEALIPIDNRELRLLLKPYLLLYTLPRRILDRIIPVKLP